MIRCKKKALPFSGLAILEGDNELSTAIQLAALELANSLAPKQTRKAKIQPRQRSFLNELREVPPQYSNIEAVCNELKEKEGSRAPYTQATDPRKEDLPILIHPYFGNDMQKSTGQPRQDKSLKPEPG